MSSEFIAGKSYNSDRRGPMRFVWSHVRRHPLIALFQLIGATSNAALAAAMFFLVGIAYDRILDFQAGEITREETLTVVVWVVIGIIISQVVRSILQFGRNFAAEVFGQRIERDVRDELYSNLLGKSMTFHDKQPIGEIMARVTNDVREMNLMMNPGFNLIIGSGMFLVMPLIYTPLISWQLTITPLVFMFAYVASQYHFVSTLHAVAQEVRASFGTMNASLAESLDGLEIVKGAAQEKSEVKKFDNLVEYVYKNTCNRATWKPSTSHFCYGALSL
jgi:ATP-binding cassette subfamily B protein